MVSADLRNEQEYRGRSSDALLEEFEHLRKKLKEQREELSRCNEAERSLRDSEEKYRFLVENSKDLIWQIDVHGRWIFISSNVEKVIGYKPDEIIGRTVWDFLSPDYYGEVKENLQKRIRGEDIPPYEVEVIGKDGRYVPFELLTVAIADEKGKVIGIQGISRDITYRKRTQKQLNVYRDELEERVKQRTFDLDKARSTLQAILETVPIGIIMADAGTEKISYYTRGAEEIIEGGISGFASGPENSSYELLRPDGSWLPIEELPLVRSLRQGERVNNMEILVRRRDGSEITILANSAPVMDVTGHITAAVASISDITHLKRTEADLRDAKEQTELYLDLMGHDINNINQIARGYLEMALDIMRKSGSLGADNKQLLDKPLEMMKNSSTLINTVRKIQSIREGDLKHEVIDLGIMLEELKKEYSYIPGRDITINFDRKGEYPVIANPLLKDVFSNLIGNAIKHSKGPLAIDIKAEEVSQHKKKYYRVAIEDTGPGIPDELKSTLLSHRKLSGKGLGLYLVRTFTRQFNGKFWIEDRVFGDYTKGCRFVVLLPAATSDK